MGVVVSKNGLTATISIPGWPLMHIDTPQGRQLLQERIARAEATFEEAYRCEMNGRTYRLRCRKIEGRLLTTGAVCEWLYNGEWRRMKNLEILSKMKEGAVKSFAAAEEK